MKSHLSSFSTRQTPQTEPIPGRTDMSENNAGGYAWEIDDWQMFRRFLTLGTEGGTYYVSERKLAKDACEATMRCIEQDGLRAVNEIVEISDKGRAANNDYAIFALAMCSAADDLATRKAALKALLKVCRIGTHLFHFAQFVEQFRGWGRGLRTAVAKWYNDMDIDRLAYQVVKYQQRDGWSHRDMLRLAKPVPKTQERDTIFSWAVGKTTFDYELGDDCPAKLLQVYDTVKACSDKHTILTMIDKYRLTREMIPTQWLTDPDVWNALLQNMPLTAMIRNLGNMSKVGLLIESKLDTIEKVTSALTKERIHKARVHPLSILAAQSTYAQGHGFRGSGSWNPVGDVIDALDGAFYDAFENVEASGKRICIGLDISGSMSYGSINGIPSLTPRVGACAMSMVTYKIEPKVAVMAFCDRFVPINMLRHQRLDDLVTHTVRLPMGGTDCALPIVGALVHKLEFDAFIIYTDSETWFGDIHPKQALDKYRQQFNLDAKLIVVAMTGNQFSIADPRDAGMLDVVGFSTASPQMISQFIAGAI